MFADGLVKRLPRRPSRPANEQVVIVDDPRPARSGNHRLDALSHIVLTGRATRVPDRVGTSDIQRTVAVTATRQGR